MSRVDPGSTVQLLPSTAKGAVVGRPVRGATTGRRERVDSGCGTRSQARKEDRHCGKLTRSRRERSPRGLCRRQTEAIVTSD